MRKLNEVEKAVCVWCLTGRLDDVPLEHHSVITDEWRLASVIRRLRTDGVLIQQGKRYTTSWTAEDIERGFKNE